MRPAKSSALSASSARTSTRKARPAASAPLNRFGGVDGSQTAAIRESFETNSPSSWIHLPLSSGKSRNTPVTFRPGRARLVTKPAATGSDSKSTATIGMDFVAPAAARTAAGPIATMPSIPSRTSSAAKPAMSSVLPARTRNSITRFVPSTKPLSCNAWRNSAKFWRKIGASGAALRTPTRTVLAARCCALAESGPARIPEAIAATKALRSMSRLHSLRRTTLKAFTGRWKPFRVSSPTASTSAISSTPPATRWASRICPGLASPQSREARLVTVPMAP